MAENKIKCLTMILIRLFPCDSEFSNEIKRVKYLNKLYSIFPNIKTKIKYKNYTENELPLMKLLCDASTYILKQWDGPLFERYRKEFIRRAIAFYKLLYKHDKDTEDGPESKIARSIKRAISKAILKLDGSKSYIKEIKSKLYLKKSNKHMVKFYKKEMSEYNEYTNLLGIDYKE